MSFETMKDGGDRTFHDPASLSDQCLSVYNNSKALASSLDFETQVLKTADQLSEVQVTTKAAEPPNTSGKDEGALGTEMLLSDEEDAIQGLSLLPVEDAVERRALCSRCSRPQKVCLCPFLPAHPLHVSTCLYIVQHPAEESRVLRTVPLLAACLPQDKCKVLIGRRFGEERYPELASVCKDSSTLILYPGAEACNLEEMSLADVQHPCSLIIIDGTWSQAKDIFYKNSLFRLPKQVQLKTTISSQYVIRTQPTNTCLSTLECAAIALSIMEKNHDIQETILRPLHALCTFQLQHGAQIHHSKQHLLQSGQYAKPMPKNKRKLKKMELLVNNVKI
ncbi:tRNA-uridine aminocarboxypropyltransferase 2 [Spea bombifrons]|uniref:tRNA-uridine aminocarboxypropyltransferase 2 n=1 Tax=Spea bombifrons TaxID=233779 RepID=UPI002349EA8F|nr:tRNA-uridine aminocarboxypropyltransferase 2 [Spea bombifrons]